MKITKVVVIGANGAMGANVAGLLAAFGGVTVYAVGRTLEKAQQGIEKAIQSVKAESIDKYLIPATYEMLPTILKEVDWVFESVSEQIEIKKYVNELINQHGHSNLIVTTGTSGLSIELLSNTLDEKFQERYIGSHFFNPPYNLPLCELIPTTKTNKEFFYDFQQYCQNILFRKTVVTKDEPAFLANRIGFQFMNEALQYAEIFKEKGGIDYIDALLGQFTGRSMSPLATIDFVGLDVHKAIVDNLYDNTQDYAHETFVMPGFVNEMIEKNLLGRKTKGGLYKRVKLDDGTFLNQVYDINTNEYRDCNKYSFDFIDEMIADIKIGEYQSAYKNLISNTSEEAKLCLQFLIKYTIYGIYTSGEIAENILDGDIAMAYGFNWLPPVAMFNLLNLCANFEILAKQVLENTYVNQEIVDSVLENQLNSPCDYRKFLKAKR